MKPRRPSSKNPRRQRDAADAAPEKETPRARQPRPGPSKAARPNQVVSETMRLNRFLARSGVASRRKADELITAGRVRINGEIVTELGTAVNPGDRVEVNGLPVAMGESIYLLLNKPTDTITTASDEKGRQTVLDLIDIEPAERAGLFPVGRLDRHTSGVLLLTNDGELAHRLTHPSYEIEKLYRVRTKEAIKPHHLEQLLAGVTLDDGEARFDRALYTSLPDHHEIGVSLHEGRNRQIRRMLESLGHEVDTLERVRYAGLTTEGVRRGKWRRLLPHEVAKLKRMVKLK